mmetsp:Transcript_53686/g.127919  ORF Transcript_53686/g.127919 Transcript_53686/m.127919 type:complete len:226 (-) Transcript_53686:171-848(-)
MVLQELTTIISSQVGDDPRPSLLSPVRHSRDGDDGGHGPEQPRIPPPPPRPQAPEVPAGRGDIPEPLFHSPFPGTGERVPGQRRANRVNCLHDPLHHGRPGVRARESDEPLIQQLLPGSLFRDYHPHHRRVWRHRAGDGWRAGDCHDRDSRGGHRLAIPAVISGALARRRPSSLDSVGTPPSPSCGGGRQRGAPRGVLHVCRAGKHPRGQLLLEVRTRHATRLPE